MRSYRTIGLTTGICLVLALPAFAQEAPDQSTDMVLDTITVSGTALSRSEAIDQKRDADQLIEALGFDELGQLPDANVGESLNRLAGVTMLVEKGEGRYVQVRGISPTLNNVTINSLSLGSPETESGGRLAPLDLISGGVLGSVQVVKVPTPDMDGQGIGATVNVETKSPFDREDDFYGYVNARYGFEEYDPIDGAYGGSNPVSIDGTVSGKSADDRWGWLAAASWSDREYVGIGIYQDDWEDLPADAATGSLGGAAPVEVKNNYYIIGRERLNLNGTLEFRPDSNSAYYLRGFYGSWEEFQHRNRYQQEFAQDVVFTSANSGTTGLNRVSPNIRLENAEKTVSSFDVGGENTFGDFNLEYNLQLGQNEISEPSSYWEWRSGRDFGPNTFEIGGDGIVSITPGAGTPNRQDPSLIDLRRVRFVEADMTEDSFAGQMDLDWDFNETTTFETGVKVRRVERNRDFAQVRYDPGVQDLTLGTSPAFTRGAFENCTPAGCAPNILMDIDAMNAFFNDPANAGFFELNTGSTFQDEFSRDYDIEETVLAAYAMGTKQFGAFELIGGVRLEQTDVDASAFLFKGGEAERISDGGDYLNVLPSVLVNYDLTDNIRVRASVSTALGRPEYDSVAPRSSFVEDAGLGALTIGNPDLEARTSVNLDASIEWYPDELSVFSVAVFSKDISDELVTLNERFATENDIANALAARGLTGLVDPATLAELTISSTTNGGSSELTGVELIAQTQFDRFLPEQLAGFGIAASAAYIDGETEINGETLPLLNQAEQTYSVTMFYQNYGFDASLSYAYNDSFLTDIFLDSPEFNLDQGEFGRWDAKVSYQIRPGFKVFAEGANLNNEPTSEFQGGRVEQNTEFEYVGTTFYLGASLAF